MKPFTSSMMSDYTENPQAKKIGALHQKAPSPSRAFKRIGEVPRPDVRKSNPKALPRVVEEYTSAMRLCTHGMTSANPSPFHAEKLIACKAL